MEVQNGCSKLNFVSFPLIIFAMYVPSEGAFDRPV